MLFQYHTLLWNHAALRVQDVRHAILQPGESLRAYQLPASVFLYTVRGKAHVLIDENEYAVDRCYVCHAGKGAFLDIAQVVEAFEYYLVFYTAVLTTPYCQKLVHRHQTSNPFQVQYGFAPQFPTPLFLGIEQMNRQWQQIGTLEQFHVKALFHQFVYELLHQLQEQGGETTQPNLVAQAMRYIEGRYAEPITLNSLAAVLDCNARQLQRLFKARLHVGPIEYLIQVRLDKAKALLQQTNVPLKQIAEAVGYTDSYYFSRMFKKYMGVSPSLFKERAWQRNDRRHNPSRLSQFPIVARRLRRYSDIGDDENHYQYKNEGAIHMYRSSKASLAISLMLSLVLLLGACSAHLVEEGPPRPTALMCSRPSLAAKRIMPIQRGKRRKARSAAFSTLKANWFSNKSLKKNCGAGLPVYRSTARVGRAADRKCHRYERQLGIPGISDG